MDRAPVFKIDRCQRMHSHGVVVRVYQVVGEALFGWDSNRDDSPADRPLHGSEEDARRASDEAVAASGHRCDEWCYRWRPLE